MSRERDDYERAVEARWLIVARAVAFRADAHPTHSICGGLCGDCDWPFRPNEPASSETGDGQ